MKLLFTSILLFISFVSYSQDEVRNISFNNTTGTSFRGSQFTIISAGLQWDFNKKYSITHWTGYQIEYGTVKSSLFSTQTIFNRYVGNWTLGIGTQYGLTSDPGVFYLRLKNQSSYAITSFTYTFDFRKH